MDENLIIFATNQNCLATKANKFSIYNILMIKTYVASLELQYLLLINLCLIVY
jgi:hypothetical protein